MKKKKRIVLLGSTGSVGSNVLRVIKELGDFTVLGLSAKGNERLLALQANRFKPSFISLVNKEKIQSLKQKLNYKCKISSGDQSLIRLATLPQAELIVIATTGLSGLLPLCAALQAGKNVALANKEAIVAAGDLINKLARKRKVRIIPIDSEHNAIFQCLQGHKLGEVKKIILPASGGPFYRKSLSFLRTVSVQDTLKHPVWKMGAKITVDSATLINKGLEIIEAQHLFGLELSQIEVRIHPQGLVHCLVELIDGAVLAFLSKPDMRLPIQYALTYPERKKSNLKAVDLIQISKLEFYKPDYHRFPGLKLSIQAAGLGGTMPAVFSAANEVAVRLFLEQKIGFLNIPRLIEKVMRRHRRKINPGLSEILQADNWARQECLRMGEF